MRKNIWDFKIIITLLLLLSSCDVPVRPVPKWYRYEVLHGWRRDTVVYFVSMENPDTVYLERDSICALTLKEWKSTTRGVHRLRDSFLFTDTRFFPIHDSCYLKSLPQSVYPPPPPISSYCCLQERRSSSRFPARGIPITSFSIYKDNLYHWDMHKLLPEEEHCTLLDSSLHLPLLSFRGCCDSIEQTLTNIARGIYPESLRVLLISVDTVSRDFKSVPVCGPYY